MFKRLQRAAERVDY